MRAVSLPRFLQSLIFARSGALCFGLLIALLVLFEFGATGAGATVAGPSPEWGHPFRW